MKYFLSVFCFFHAFVLRCQINEDFSDNNLTLNPSWTGSINNFIINSSQQLQLNATTAGSSQLTTPHGLTNLDDKEWHFWIKLGFSPSSNNNSRVYLCADNSDLSIQPNGYYLQFGEAGSGDLIRLMKLENNETTEILTDSESNINSSFALSVKITHNASGLWKMYLDAEGGSDFVLVSQNTDNSTLIGSYFGFVANYTISNTTKFYYDNIYIGPIVIDAQPPEMISASPINENQIDILFDEPLQIESAQIPSNYHLDPENNCVTAQLDVDNPKLVHLLLENNLINGTNYTLSINNITDVEGNIQTGNDITFWYLISEAAQKGDILINEIMADPSPSAGLPEVEYIEVYNQSSKIFQLSGWKLSDASGAGTIESGWLFPGEYKILCASSALESFPQALSVTSFPSYNNVSDYVSLQTIDGLIIDSLTYTDDWYSDETKKTGGFSLERINPNDPCSDQNNWIASNANFGGSPAFQNSVFNTVPDTEAPSITNVHVINNQLVEVLFNEPMDSIALSDATVLLTNQLTITEKSIHGQFPNSIKLYTYPNIEKNQVYSLTMEGIKDCWLNNSSSDFSFIYPDTADINDLIINELLFDPYTGGSDFIELYNRSYKIIDLFGYEIANYDNDTINNHKMINSHYLIKPGEYVFLSADINSVKTGYPFATENAVNTILPSLNIDSSTVFLIFNNKIIDKVSYSDNWHFALLEDPKGKSLERIDPNSGSNDPKNWHTASETKGFATPGRENSQNLTGQNKGDFDFSNKVISPDNDGYEDVLQINYSFEESGLVGTLTIYDDLGRVITKLINNELMGNSGTWHWDGITDQKQKASVGNYIAVLEAFHPASGTKIFRKKVFVVAGKLE